MARRPKQIRDDGADTPLLEWIAGGIGAVLFTLAMGVTLANGFSEDEPPAISARVEPARPVGGRFRVEFEAVNSGDETAADVQFLAVLREGDAVIETRGMSVDFLPPHSQKRAGVFFDSDPAGRTVSITAVGYQHP